MSKLSGAADSSKCYAGEQPQPVQAIILRGPTAIAVVVAQTTSLAVGGALVCFAMGVDSATCDIIDIGEGIAAGDLSA